MKLVEFRSEVWQLLNESTPLLNKRFIEYLTITKNLDKDSNVETFSFFFEEHAQRAADIYNSFFAIADDAPDEESAISNVLSRYKELRSSINPDLLNFSLSVFITHYEGTISIELPPLTVREPELFLISRNSEKEGSSTPENRLDWFREDPLLNEHHEHWHIVYPFLGIERKKKGRIELIFRDRQGEIFIYMHQQMLARYDVERLAIGLERVTPYSDFSTAIESGYDPGEFIRNTFNYHSKRDPNTTPGDIDREMYGRKFKKTVKEHHEVRDKLISAIKSGYFETLNGKKWRITPDLLGATIEASRVASVDKDYYDFYHNNGHRFIAVAHDPKGISPMGVMSRPETSFRDPVFYRWHKHLDDLSVLWQNSQQCHSFSDFPRVELRKGLDENAKPWSPDLILCNQKELIRLYDLGVTHEDILSFLGESNWGKDFSHGRFKLSDDEEKSLETTKVLETRMEEGVIHYEDSLGHKKNHKYEYINNEPFVYFIRIYNHLPYIKTVTFRTFIVLEGYDDDRSMYIEMDKFKTDLNPRHNVICRPSTESSIVRKPAILDPASQNTNYSPDWIPLPSLASKDHGDIEKLKLFKERLNTYRKRMLNGAELYFLPIEVRLNKLLEEVENDPSQSNIKVFASQLSKYRSSIYDYSFDRSFCNCGLPYSMLLPRGTKNGLEFKLFVLVSDWELDRVGDDNCCSSMSYCGAKDRYPDIRPMGYPFDRPFKRPILETFRDLPNTAFRSITIKCNNL